MDTMLGPWLSFGFLLPRDLLCLGADGREGFYSLVQFGNLLPFQPLAHL